LYESRAFLRPGGSVTVGLSGVCYIVSVVLFAIAAWPRAADYRLEMVGLAFFAAGHVLP
jgi:hypothetical protein